MDIFYVKYLIHVSTKYTITCILYDPSYFGKIINILQILYVNFWLQLYLVFTVFKNPTLITQITTYHHFFLKLYLWAFCLYLIGQLRADRKALGEERGAGLVKDLEMGIELGSPRAQLCYMLALTTGLSVLTICHHIFIVTSVCSCRV